MGNAGSKTSRRKSSSQNNDSLPFSRTDTAQSGKSTRSLRSIRSQLSINSDTSRRKSINIAENNGNGTGLVPDKLDSLERPRHYSVGNVTKDTPVDGGRFSLQKSRTQSSDTRKSSIINIELPPSMIQVEPKSPILRTSRNASWINTENALTDDDNEDDCSGQAPSRSPSKSRKRYSLGAEAVGTVGSVNASESVGRSISHGSINHSRRSSLGSTGNTAFSTPLNSPAVKTYNQEDEAYLTSPSNFSLDNKESVDSFQNGQSDDMTNTGDLSSYNFANQCDNFEGPNKKTTPTKTVDIDATIQKLLDAGYAAKRTKSICLKNSEIARICQQAREIFLSQPPLLDLSSPVKIVGDVHGQFADLLRLFTKCGFPPLSNYLFLGDYVDRGKQSLETILLLLCYKIKYPENLFLLRGNHECASVTRVYGFYDECKRRCNIKTWKTFVDTFNTLPLAAIVSGKIFCVHGGLSPVLNSMDEIRHVSRPTDVPDFGLINDLLWSDPAECPNEWEDNERGVSYCYNKVTINKFLNKFDFDLVCRAHMVVEDGYEFFNDRSLVTVFSAPNYCGEFDNWGAVMSVSEGLLCSFELLDPLDGPALKQVMKKGRQERKLANQQQQQLSNQDNHL